MKAAKLIQLGWSQLAVMGAALLTLFIVLWILFAYDWYELYYREIVIPRLQTKYGFRVGHVTIVRGGTTFYDGDGVKSVEPAGKLALIGVRPGDAPFEYHGGGFTSMAYALETAERGGFASFDVVNAYDYAAGVDAFRTVYVHPRVREAPVPLTRHTQLRSPSDPRTVVAFDSDLDGDPRELWLWDPVGGSRRKLLAIRASVAATWSGDGNWVAVTDKDWMRPSRCVVIDVKDGSAVDLNEALVKLADPMRPRSSERLECEVFGWVLDQPARVAVIFRDLSATRGARWIYDYFFDVAAQTLVAAPSF